MRPHETPLEMNQLSAHNIEELHAGRFSAVGVARSGGEFRLVTVQAVASGAVVFRLEGDETPTPTRYSVQIGKDLHIDLGSEREGAEVLDRYPWRFMNHHCEPSTAICGRDVVALRALSALDDVTFHYNTTEEDMAEPFLCRCGSLRCEGSIRGARHLTSEARDRLRPWMAAHLLGD